MGNKKSNMQQDGCRAALNSHHCTDLVLSQTISCVSLRAHVMAGRFNLSRNKRTHGALDIRQHTISGTHKSQSVRKYLATSATLRSQRTRERKVTSLMWQWDISPPVSPHLHIVCPASCNTATGEWSQEFLLSLRCKNYFSGKGILLLTS
jgi:hypothetical protein